VRGNQFRPDSFEHAFYVAQYLIVPETGYSKSLRFQVHGPHGITLHFICVLTTVELHDQSLLKAHEIDDVRLDDLLPSELRSDEQSIALMPPQQLLCVCLVGAKVSSQRFHWL
jgi:hypothetical protein